MKPINDTRPPRWAQRLLHWYCKPELAEDLEGDLNEYFERNVVAKGPRRARWIYIADVFKFFRLYTIRKPEFVNLLLHWIMIGSYVKTSGRSLMRHKLFSFINIAGLAVSMSVGLLVIALVTELLSFDDFHAKKDRIYRVITHDQRLGEPAMDLATTSLVAGKKVDTSLSGIEDFTLVRNGFSGDARIGESVIPVSAVWADEHFFNIFSFPLLQGNPATALKEPYSLVLSEKMCKTLFGDVNVLGKSVVFDTTNYVVTGVVKDVPKNSHLRFDALVSFSSAKEHREEGGSFNTWTNIYSICAYVLLPKDSDPAAFQANLDKLSAAENARIEHRTISLQLQPLENIVLGKKLSNQIGPVMRPVALYFFEGLAFIIILSAGFNYTNLSIARSMRRTREVGIRKVMGALKHQVGWQFIVESTIIALMALAIALVLFLFLRVQFLSLDRFLSDLVSLDLTSRMVLYFVLMALVVGFGSGLLPAVFFSKINAIQVLKGSSALKVFRHVNLRKALIVVQYCFSLIFITTTLIGYNQYKSFLTFDLGFNTAHILNIRLQHNKEELIKKELAEVPEVGAISVSRIVTSLGSLQGAGMKYKDLNDSIVVWLNYVDEQYLPLHGHTFLAGKNLKALPDGAEESEAVVNEQLLKRFNISPQDPAKALGEIILIDEKKLAIVGVVKDFHYGTVENSIEPMALRYSAHEPWGYLNVKVTTNDWPATRARIEAAWQKVDKVHPLDAKFYDDQIEEAYRMFATMIKVIGTVAFLAVCIASLGLFGMVVFTAETRLKEISIRKVLGASEGRLIYLLSKGFLFLLLLAAAVALPFTYLLFDRVVLVNFVYHPPLGYVELVISLVSVTVIALLMIGSQTLKVARANPSEVLKNE
ncbi:FtsX-like permease family protein [Chryseolinea serpens]|uniref:FtsX-like permease family protein n=1 Tax=Chryseolinea serpens TaxID=947013 RepID=A0A1M5KT89_9BACT|nr:ABC transporter permease [Chryseolinea serpens]SHG55383.1 FtsX-like permease family protein [Chryseolinea serpens]